MIYTAIDGDISDFLDSREIDSVYRSEDLRTYLLNEGHDDGAVVVALTAWQKHYFSQVEGRWERFRLTNAGKAAVVELRRR